MVSPSPTQQILLRGEAGQIELLVDRPAASPRGVAVVAHPHPMQGGTATHKVPQQLAKVLVARGYLVVRPNFRGVGATEGQHDGGKGETRDTIAVIEHLRKEHPGLPMVLAGFSFGAFVMAHAAAVLADRGIAFPHLILTGMPWGEVHTGSNYDTPAVAPTALVVHGEQDDRVTLSAIFEWARPQQMPVVVIPGANHFFTGKLAVLGRVVDGYLDGVERGLITG
ncbi:hypothetical protein L602_000400000480 [Cupriavidus gilardii J11]|uniref:Serine aminopeptidase S33 domain-containing protein n=1 Tax=Cupriavidus gilardii J11 TaxID=936133 RepID=A0A562B9T9_9BURK|nr:alpha/beta fold hydrolase [Cupriavidus gilardii]TWG81729.1 hypothetical protein L602_000400000480 [Cupriavidus gilardii J11]